MEVSRRTLHGRLLGVRVAEVERRWRPGPWVEAREVKACEQGVHGCGVDQLAWWMIAQLWEIELDGPVDVKGHKMVARRGRLKRLVALARSRVPTWPNGRCCEFATTLSTC